MAPKSTLITQRGWPGLAFLVVLSILGASVWWDAQHPTGVDWDESHYMNQAYEDAAVEKSPSKVAKRLLVADRVRPPAYRLLAFPVTSVVGVTPSTLRYISLAALALMLLLLFLTGAALAGRSAGAIAVIFLVLCPTVIRAGREFLTEYPLYLAIAGTMYFVLREWDRDQESRLGWVGLGVALGLGFLAKISFIGIAVPMLIAVGVLRWNKRLSGPDVSFIGKGVTLGGLLCLPWWALNYRSALAGLETARTFARHSLGAHSFEMLWDWVRVFAHNAVGLPLAILVVALAAAYCVDCFASTGKASIRSRSGALLVLFVGTVPLLIAQLTGENHLVRHISPALIPMALLVGVGSAVIGWSKRWAYSSLIALLFLFQLGREMTGVIQPVIWPYETRSIIEAGKPQYVFALHEQWDWTQLRQLCGELGISEQTEEPTIVYLGGDGRVFNSSQIALPWIRRHEPVDVDNIWKLEEGDLDWGEIRAEVDEADVVLVPPAGYRLEFMERDHLDNQYNEEFNHRLQGRSDFSAPIRLRFGRFSSTDVTVFVRKSSIRTTSVGDRSGQLGRIAGLVGRCSSSESLRGADLWCVAD